MTTPQVSSAAPSPDAASPSRANLWVTPLVMGALASVGAGLVHAAAAGTHNSDRTVALIFGATAAIQIGWAGLAIVRPRRDVAILGLVVNAVALAAWALSRTQGLPLVQGMAEKAEVGTQDLIGAILAGLAVTGAGVALTRRSAAKVPNLVAGAAAAALVMALAVPAMAAPHAHGEADQGAGDTAAAAHHGAGSDTSAGHADGHNIENAAAHSAAVAVAYDPAKPIELGGTPGVTPEQQAEAENVVAETLRRLPQWSDPEYALANGFFSIGDGPTGTEHFINPQFQRDEFVLDPDRPESLVWDVKDGKRTLAAAMYMTKPGVPLADVPKFGGGLVQWHIHNNLCYNSEGKVRGLTNAEGNCPAGLVKPVETPMVHVWIRKHKCGPFAALEGIGGGNVAPGEEKLCDTAHGGH